MKKGDASVYEPSTSTCTRSVPTVLGVKVRFQYETFPGRAYRVKLVKSAPKVESAQETRTCED